jgi:UDP-N-acetylglucosamine 4,6-dehydratase
LLTKEEYIKAEDMGGFFRVPADKRDLNYDKYFVEGDVCLSVSDEYNSHNTYRLNVEEIKDKLLQLNYIKTELSNWKPVKKTGIKDSKTKQKAREMLEKQQKKREA